MSNQKQNQSNPQSTKQSYKKYAAVSALAFQWIGLFVLLSLGGNWLDHYLDNHFPIFTLAGVFLALFFIFYSIFKLAKQSNQD
jgi:F0F1-type ATP synthase assembly protein I